MTASGQALQAQTPFRKIKWKMQRRRRCRMKNTRLRRQTGGALDFCGTYAQTVQFSAVHSSVFQCWGPWTKGKSFRWDVFGHTSAKLTHLHSHARHKMPRNVRELQQDTNKMTGMTCFCEGLHRRSLKSAHLAEEL